VGERWALLVVRDLLLGPKRFNDLLAGLPGVSPNVLTQRLRDLADHGVVRRTSLGPPTRVHLYELTEWGRELEPLLIGLGRWGSRAPSRTDRPLGVDSLMLSVKAGFRPDRSAALRGDYEIHVGADTYRVDVTDAAMHVERQAEPGTPDAAIVTDLDTLRDIAAARLTVDDADRQGVLRFEGDKAARKCLAEILVSAFSAPDSRAG